MHDISQVVLTQKDVGYGEVSFMIAWQQAQLDVVTDNINIHCLIHTAASLLPYACVHES